MIARLTTKAELLAEQAEALPAFSGIKLLHIKRQLAELLALIGRNGIFDEYTRHDITHVDEMLGMLDWLIPDSTKSIMSPADWLFAVLAIYFHDVGMLVTKDEYTTRFSSDFPEFRDGRLFAAPDGPDYRAKVQQMAPDEAERFLYQEFVRHKHAERIRAWVVGKAPEYLGITGNIVAEIDALLKPLDTQVRNDIALVCESHHLDDLYDIRKYKPSQPYGNSDAETVNLQFAAVLLRSADLLDIARDRTPAITFRIINPSDPISVGEWARHMAVKRVRPQFGRDREGNFDELAPRDTIEVHAFFTQEDGFFGLTSYLVYAEAQIRKCNEWIEATRRRQIAPHEYPWKHIDDANVETQGFLKDTFEFTIDQAKVLDLLTGHTLYNDTRVVIRELIQNALDAIRLQQLIDDQSGMAPSPGRVAVQWDSERRILTVTDDGTGMTQLVIEKHLLKVGSSRYQDSEFRRQYPTFSSISRFGIGVLSTFMIADSVEITTCHPEEPEARQLSLRSVHGKYLIRLLDKQTVPSARQLLPHGTIVRLTIRPSADIGDVLETVRRWIVVPGCDVTVSIDNGSPHQVGFQSPKDAVEDLIKQINLAPETRIRVEQEALGGVTLAYALIWAEYFREWEFLDLRIYDRPSARVSGQLITDEKELARPLCGTCVEGVRVEFATPGFKGLSILAIANAKGPEAPKTNVARTGLEINSELDNTLQAIYQIYLRHVVREFSEMREKRLASVTWAAFEARYLLAPMYGGSRDSSEKPLNSELLLQRMNSLPLVLVEHEGERTTISSDEVAGQPMFWTIDGPFFRSAEWILRELPGSASLSALMTTFNTGSRELPRGLIVCGSRVGRLTVEENVFANREVDQVVILRDERRLDLRWVAKTKPPRWHENIVLQGSLMSTSLQRAMAQVTEYFDSSYSYRLLVGDGRLPDVRIGRSGIEVAGLNDEIALVALGITFILPNTRIANYLLSLVERLENERTDRALAALAAVLLYVEQLVSLPRYAHERSTVTERMPNVLKELMAGANVDIIELETVLKATNWKSYDPSRWTRERGGMN